MTRYLAVDLGARKTGLAWCGATHLVEALDVVPTAQLSQAIRRWVTDLEIDILVYGLPLRAGKLAGAAKKVRREARLMAAQFELPVEFVDETGTTDEAMHRPGSKGLDARAAALILQRYLDQGPWRPERKTDG
ncbi:MAG: Holliday junction resolvase RuvX [Myxococcales bacterium]|nr:Holliday junction resolvase RuvX [Myxococcales bacterium]